MHHIYSTVTIEEKKFVLLKPKFRKNSLLARIFDVIFGNQDYIIITTKEKVIKYSYVEPKKGQEANVILPTIGFYFNVFKKKVALLHTHGAYSDEYNNDVFSKTDKTAANILGVPYYVITPLGTLRKYDPATGNDIILYSNLPYDKNHPNRRG